MGQARASAVPPLGVRGHGFAVAASVLILAGVSFALAGCIEMGRLRALVDDSRDAAAVRESERALELELGPELLEFERQLDVARAAARSPREPGALDAAAPEERK